MSQTFSNVRGPSGDEVVSGGDCFGFDVGDISGFTYLSSYVIAISDISFWLDSPYVSGVMVPSGVRQSLSGWSIHMNQRLAGVGAEYRWITQPSPN